MFLAATTRGTLRIDAWVNVSGRTRLNKGPGIMRKKSHWNHQAIRRGRTRRGTRQMREMKDDEQIVPSRVENVCDAAARTIALDGVFGGIVCRWKYH